MPEPAAAGDCGAAPRPPSCRGGSTGFAAARLRRRLRAWIPWTGPRCARRCALAGDARFASSESRPCSAWEPNRRPWLFVGEGPGADEDEKGEPFVGQAGKLLDSMLAAAKLARGREVYIANVVKCRPPGNRVPAHDEAAACAGMARPADRARRRLASSWPSARPPPSGSRATRRASASLRGKVHAYRGIPARHHLPSRLPAAKPPRQGQGVGGPAVRTAHARTCACVNAGAGP